MPKEFEMFATLKKLSSHTILLASLIASSKAWSIVDMKNAAYIDQAIDIQITNGTSYELKLNRIYSSRFNFTGILGYGWCTDFETSVDRLPDGGIKLQACGAGQETVFKSSKDKDTSVAVVDQILENVKKEKSTSVATPQYIKDLRAQLLANASQRLTLAKAYGIKIPEIKRGTNYVAEGNDADVITFDGTYYVRNQNDGSSQKFDANGKLVYLYDKNGNYLKMVYQADVLKEVQDNNSRKLTFTYKNKRVSEIIGPAQNGKPTKVTYEYKGEDLAKVNNMWGNDYLYEYDDVHNVTKITFPDKTSKIITYDKKNDWVMSFTDRYAKGVTPCTESYTYESDKNEPRDHFWSTATKKCGTEITNQARFEFWHKKRADGRKYLARALTKTNTENLDVSYHPEFGRPTILKKNGYVTTFSYFPSGLIQSKTTENAKMSFEYKNSFNKVSKVTTEFFNEETKKLIRKRDTTFTYDAKANLIAASNTDGQHIKLSYDGKGRIATIVDQAKKEVKIQYDDKISKPSVITRPSLGSIVVSYKANGEIEKVDSKEGPNVALQVASTFNNLLEIIAPATSELSL